MCFSQETQERKNNVSFSGVAKTVVICPKLEPLLYMVIQKKGYFPRCQCKILCAYIQILRDVFIFDEIQTIILVENDVIQKINQ